MNLSSLQQGIMMETKSELGNDLILCYFLVNQLTIPFISVSSVVCLRTVNHYNNRILKCQWKKGAVINPRMIPPAIPGVIHHALPLTVYLASVIGEEELTPLDHTYLEFGDAFEQRFLSQRPDEERSIEQSLDLGWNVLSILPQEELHRISQEEISKYYGKQPMIMLS